MFLSKSHHGGKSSRPRTREAPSTWVRRAGASAVEHYEISRYSTLRTRAAPLGLNDAIDLLEDTLGEEKKTDEFLTELADAKVN